jgi:hypothetical protein
MDEDLFSLPWLASFSTLLDVLMTRNNLRMNEGLLFIPFGVSEPP